MIGRYARFMLGLMATSRLSDHEIMSRMALRSVHRGKRNPPFQGRRVLAENSSLKKRMRVGEFTEVKMTPARKREFWHAVMRQRWNDIRNLATDLEKDRERRRLMRFAA